jgi:hypothetical protein
MLLEELRCRSTSSLALFTKSRVKTDLSCQGSGGEREGGLRMDEF